MKNMFLIYLKENEDNVSSKEQIAIDWLRSKYERTDNELDVIEIDEIVTSFSDHFAKIANASYERNAICDLVKKAFGRLSLVRIGESISSSIPYYSCMRNKPRNAHHFIIN